MKFKGRIAIWFYVLVIGMNIVILQNIFLQSGNITLTAQLIVLFVINILFLPVLIRNYTVLEPDLLTVAFGFMNCSMEYADIMTIRKTHNPIASTAASLNRIHIQGRRNELMFAVKDEKAFFEALLEKCPQLWRNEDFPGWKK